MNKVNSIFVVLSVLVSIVYGEDTKAFRMIDGGYIGAI